MIKVTSSKSNPLTGKFMVSLFSDTKSEVTSSATIEGLPSGAEIDQGSNVITASGEVAFMKSDGTWNWV